MPLFIVSVEECHGEHRVHEATVRAATAEDAMDPGVSKAMRLGVRVDKRTGERFPRGRLAVDSGLQRRFRKNEAFAYGQVCVPAQGGGERCVTGRVFVLVRRKERADSIVGEVL